ncbi:peptidase M61 [Sphingomonas sp. CL5.1]|uniref:M61 family metallopeptidase n=1 Tax=Sphingomonas sp. CL5.1 TaxID=2653203 RepID=UPI0015837D0B|nr:peptidase M61 [Sphingomonas sp. CL5.1]QKR99605.1 peptidase M61 [Sphingomonas sp. CL5.1]
MKARLAIAALAPVTLAGAAAPDAAPLATVTITPARLGSPEGTGDVGVELSIPGVSAAAGTRLVTIGTWVPGMARPLTIRDMRLTDDGGAVPVSAAKGGQGPSDNTNEGWTIGRAVSGTLRVSYHLMVENVPLLRGGPPVQPRIDGASVSSVGAGLIAAVKTDAPYRIALRWDLSQAGAGAAAATSWGDGDVELPAGPLARLGDTVFMAGKIRSTPNPPAGPFLAVWGGTPSFDPAPSMEWTRRLHGWMSKFFGDTDEPAYRVFIRYNPMNAGGGAAFPHSFLMTWGAGVNGDNWKPILGHEMTHTWTAIDIGDGKWYSEGIAVYYQAQLAWRAGLMSTDDYLADLNMTASRYYTDALRSTPEDQVVAHFWEDTRIRVLPYDRGALYFAALNGMVRRASGGRRSIDELIFAMNRRAAAGDRLTEDDWLALIGKEAGPEALALHKAMLAGGLVLPRSDDFGPCFHRVEKPIRRFDLGFDNGSLLGDDKIVRGLKPGSEAEKAGLRNGDHIAYGVALDSVQAEVHHQLALTVTRDGKSFPLTYLPRGEAVPAYQWERVAGVPDEKCRP